MAIPSQVQRAADRANELLDQINAPPAEPAPAELQVPLDPPVETIELAPETPPAEPAPAPAPAPAEDWEHKYRTLQGVLAAEKRQSAARMAEMEARINAAPAPAPVPEAPPAPTSRVTAQDTETYGAELVDLIGRKAAEIAEAEIAKMRAELQPQLEQTRAQVTEFGQQVYATREAEFYGELTKAVPDWQSINTNQDFFDWLAEVDPMSGVPRQVYLNKAGQDFNHSQAAILFNAFKSAKGIAAPAPAAPAPAAAPAPTARLSPSPRTTGVASAPSHTAPDNSVSRSAIAAHYSRGARDPEYAKSEAHAKMELKIQTALASNQVTEA